MGLRARTTTLGLAALGLFAVASACGGQVEEREKAPGASEWDSAGGSGGNGSGGTAAGGKGSTNPPLPSAGTGGGDSSAGGAAVGSGGSAGGGTAGTTPDPPACKGIRQEAPCAPEGQSCVPLQCGLADTGIRQCHCATVWSCTLCDYSNSPLKDPPADIPHCTGVEFDKVPCQNEWELCEGAPGGEVCACYVDDEGALIWDCDQPPSTWL